MLENKNIILGLTGGIACYKAVSLASLLRKNKANVYAVMTKNSKKFITPLTLKTITKNRVTTKLFNTDDFIPHISLGDMADLIVIAPASANIIAKASNGIADDILSTLLLSSKAPKLIVPSMNTNMYLNPVTQNNIKKLKDNGYYFIEPDNGELACGTGGVGRFPDIERIYGQIERILTKKTIFNNKKVLITLGGTVEDIDPVRCITNRASGKMGFAFANEFYLRGAYVKIIAGNCNELVRYNFTKKFPEIQILDIRSTKQLKETIDKEEYDVLFMSMAVSDFTVQYNEKKIKKDNDQNNFTLNLIKTNDVLKSINKNINKIYIGFAAESENIIKNAKEKLIKKNLDFIIANSIIGKKSAIGNDYAECFLLNKWNEIVDKYDYTSKEEIANQILTKIENIIDNNYFKFN